MQYHLFRILTLHNKWLIYCVTALRQHNGTSPDRDAEQMIVWNDLVENKTATGQLA